MEIINIIVSHPETAICSIVSYGVAVPELKSEVVEEAEQHFVEKCVELKYGEDMGESREDLNERNFYREDVSEEMEDGYVEVGEYTVSIVWSSLDNIQQ